MIIHGDSIEKLKELEPNSIEALVTDPPYGLGDTSPTAVAECLNSWLSGSTYNPKGSGFMNKAWDKWVPDPALWREVYRVLKPGAHGLVFSGSRTEDLMSISLRLSGFEVRDRLVWLYSSGMPKNFDIAKGIESKIRFGSSNQNIWKKLGGEVLARENGRARFNYRHGSGSKVYGDGYIKKSELVTDEAKRWIGFGTCLKPSYEPIILIRKPLMGSIVDNVAQFNTGGLNIDGCRIKTDGHTSLEGKQGRWPANFLLDDSVQDSSIQRYFFCSKPTVAEKTAGLNNNAMHPTTKPIDLMRYLCKLITPPNGTVLDPFAGSGTTLCAAALEGFNVLGVERELEYVRIAEARLAHWSGGAYEPSTPTDTKPTIKTGDQLNLF